MNEMKDFKDEMKDFKDEAEDFKTNAEADRKRMNKPWGEFANKMGTIVEDIVVPSVQGIAREYFNVDEFDIFAIRYRKKALMANQYATSMSLQKAKITDNFLH